MKITIRKEKRLHLLECNVKKAFIFTEDLLNKNKRGLAQDKKSVKLRNQGLLNSM